MIPTFRLVLSVAPAASSATEPLDVIRASVAEPNVASSFYEKPSATAVLVRLSAPCTVSPWWTLPKASGAIALAAARR